MTQTVKSFWEQEQEWAAEKKKKKKRGVDAGAGPPYDSASQAGPVVDTYAGGEFDSVVEEPHDPNLGGYGLPPSGLDGIVDTTSQPEPSLPGGAREPTPEELAEISGMSLEEARTWIRENERNLYAPPPGIEDRSRLAPTAPPPPGIQDRSRLAGIVDTTDLPPGIQDRSRLAPTAPIPPGIEDRSRLAGAGPTYDTVAQPTLTELEARDSTVAQPTLTELEAKDSMVAAQPTLTELEAWDAATGRDVVVQDEQPFKGFDYDDWFGILETFGPEAAAAYQKRGAIPPGFRPGGIEDQPSVDLDNFFKGADLVSEGEMTASEMITRVSEGDTFDEDVGSYNDVVEQRRRQGITGGQFTTSQDADTQFRVFDDNARRDLMENTSGLQLDPSRYNPQDRAEIERLNEISAQEEQRRSGAEAAVASNVMAEEVSAAAARDAEDQRLREEREAGRERDPNIPFMEGPDYAALAREAEEAAVPDTYAGGEFAPSDDAGAVPDTYAGGEFDVAPPEGEPPFAPTESDFDLEDFFKGADLVSEGEMTATELIAGLSDGKTVAEIGLEGGPVEDQPSVDLDNFFKGADLVSEGEMTSGEMITRVSEGDTFDEEWEEKFGDEDPAVAVDEDPAVAVSDAGMRVYGQGDESQFLGRAPISGVEAQMEGLAKELGFDVEGEVSRRQEVASMEFDDQREQLGRMFALEPGAEGQMQRRFEELAGAEAEVLANIDAETRAQLREEARRTLAGMTGLQESREAAAGQAFGLELQEAGLYGEDVEGRTTLGGSELGLEEELGRGGLALSQEQMQLARDSFESESGRIQQELEQGNVSLAQAQQQIDLARTEMLGGSAEFSAESLGIDTAGAFPEAGEGPLDVQRYSKIHDEVEGALARELGRDPTGNEIDIVLQGGSVGGRKTLAGKAQEKSFQLQNRGFELESRQFDASMDQFDSQMDMAADRLGLDRDEMDRAMDLRHTEIENQVDQFEDTLKHSWRELGLDRFQITQSIQQQDMERAARYDHLASQLGLETDQFEQAVHESARSYNSGRADAARAHRLDKQRFGLARDQVEQELQLRRDEIADKYVIDRWALSQADQKMRNDVMLREVDQELAATEAARRFDLDEDIFEQATEEFDRQQTQARLESAKKYNLDLKRFTKASQQFDKQFNAAQEQQALNMGIQAEQWNAASAANESREKKIDAYWQGVMGKRNISSLKITREGIVSSRSKSDYDLRDGANNYVRAQRPAGVHSNATAKAKWFSDEEIATIRNGGEVTRKVKWRHEWGKHAGQSKEWESEVTITQETFDKQIGWTVEGTIAKRAGWDTAYEGDLDTFTNYMQNQFPTLPNAAAIALYNASQEDTEGYNADFIYDHQTTPDDWFETYSPEQRSELSHMITQQAYSAPLPNEQPSFWQSMAQTVVGGGLQVVAAAV